MKSPRDIPAVTVASSRAGTEVVFGAALPVIVCGPCVIESRDHALRHAEQICRIVADVGLPLVFKSSYDKANRTSANSFRGPGIEEGLSILQAVRKEFGVPVVTDIHTPAEAEAAAGVVDVLQIPAFLCRQTDLLLAAGAAKKPVLVKKGQFLAPDDMQFVQDKLRAGGASGVVLCERGACFGYRDLVVDYRSIERMHATGCPVVFDGTHSVQQMGGAGGASSGDRTLVPLLVRAAVAAGVEGVFVEAHESPDTAPSDGPNMIPLDSLAPLLRDVKRLAELALETR
ncbi:MAG: 3-deoxy-8-phosphooctulonate synthase [Bdellovibrionales bacterium]|nr:3-deoxy-8-phosphooctulonate synthase [Bdellovibrionales bacterium]